MTYCSLCLAVIARMQGYKRCFSSLGPANKKPFLEGSTIELSIKESAVCQALCLKLMKAGSSSSPVLTVIYERVRVWTE